MLETDLTTLFNLEAAAEQPAAQISLPAARRAARIRRSWHRTLVIATPVMAAGAVLAIVAGATLLTSGSAAPARKTGPVAPSFAKLRQGFDPMRIYASFGWLPAGTSIARGETSRTLDVVATQGTLAFSLLVHQPGWCTLRPVSAGSGSTELSCSTNSPAGGSPPRVTGRAPDIGGHPAYWASNNSGPMLIWAYSAGAWVELEYFSSCQASQPPVNTGSGCIRRATLVEVARRARIGLPADPVVFPAVLTNVPKNWRVATTSFTAQHGRLLASGIQVSAGANLIPPLSVQPANTPFLQVIPTAEEKAITDTYCTAGSFPGGHPRREVINGYQVLAGYVRAPYSPTYQACSPDADGLLVFIEQLGAHPTLSVTALFSRLHLLGTDPADWTTKPVG